MPHRPRHQGWASVDRLIRFGRVVLVLVPVFALLHAVVAVPRISEWGTTGAERRAGWPGDGLTDARYTWTNAITIDAPADRVWPWVTQLGQGRAGLYSYDWVENAMFAGIRSKDRILAEHQRPLAVGDKVVRMTRYSPYNPVALYVPGRALVLGAVGDNVDELRAGHASSTWAFIVEPVGSDTSRLIVRSRSSDLATRLQAPAQFVMQRKLMEGVKARAEGTWTPSPGDVIEPLTWLVVAGTTTVAAWFATRRRRDWWQPLAVAVLGGCVLGYLLFWQPPLPVAITLALLMAFAGAADQYNVRTRIRSESTSARRPRLKHAGARGPFSVRSGGLHIAGAVASHRSALRPCTAGCAQAKRPYPGRPCRLTLEAWGRGDLTREE